MFTQRFGLFTLLVVTHLPLSAVADAPAVLPVRGFLENTQGPVTGDTSIVFALYEAEEEETPLFEETGVVAVDAGEFSFLLGTSGGLDFFNLVHQPELWFGMVVDGQELLPRQRLATAPAAIFAQFADNADLVGGVSAAALARSGHASSWGEVDQIPADIADGDQDVLAAMATSCGEGDVPMLDSQGWICVPGSDLTALSGNSGIAASGNSDVLLSADLSALQAKVDSCPDSQSIQRIYADGRVDCLQDTVAPSTIPEIYVSRGIVGGGTGDVDLAIDTDVVQPRVESCGRGHSIRTIGKDGSVVCQLDDRASGDITGVNTADDSGLIGGTSSGVANLRVQPAHFNKPGSASAGSTNQDVTFPPDPFDPDGYETLLSFTFNSPGPGNVVLFGTADWFCADCDDYGFNYAEVTFGWWTGSSTATVGVPSDTMVARSVRYDLSRASTNPMVIRRISVNTGTYLFALRARNENPPTIMRSYYLAYQYIYIPR